MITKFPTISPFGISWKNHTPPVTFILFFHSSCFSPPLTSMENGKSIWVFSPYIRSSYPSLPLWYQWKIVTPSEYIPSLIFLSFLCCFSSIFTLRVTPSDYFSPFVLFCKMSCRQFWGFLYIIYFLYFITLFPMVLPVTIIYWHLWK